MFDRIWFPGEGEDVQDGEYGHLDAEQDGRNADFDIGIGEDFRGLEGSVGGGEEGNDDLNTPLLASILLFEVKLRGHVPSAKKRRR